MSRHFTEDDLILFHYGEARRQKEIAAHLASCDACRQSYQGLSETLSLIVAPEAPARGDQFGLEVWQRIRHQLPEHRLPWWAFHERLLVRGLAAAAAVAVLMVAAFVAGYNWRPSGADAARPAQAAAGSGSGPSTGSGDSADRILLTAVEEHLERSERVLTEIMNGPDHEDISLEQQWADDLLSTNRLYRQDAEDAGERSVAGVLDDLERSLMEIVHSPSRISAEELDQIRRRIDATALLFKVRILGDELRGRQMPPSERAFPLYADRNQQLMITHFTRLTTLSTIVIALTVPAAAQVSEPQPPKLVKQEAREPRKLREPREPREQPTPPDARLETPDVDLSTLEAELSELSHKLAEEAARMKLDALQTPTPPAAPQPRVVLPPAPPGAPVPPVGVFFNNADQLYDQGRNLIEQGRYDRALNSFERLIELKTKRTDAAMFWKVYTLQKLGEPAKALTTLGDMEKQFADSRWLKDAKALEVELRQASGQTVSPDTQNSEELKLLALRGLMQNDPDQALPIIERMINGSDTPRVKERALFVLSQSRNARAREIIGSVAKGNGNPDMQVKAVNYLGIMNAPESRQILEDVYKATNDETVKRAVMRALMSSRDNPRLLIVARTEGFLELRRYAINMLGTMRAGPSLSELYQTEPSIELKKSIVAALGGMRDATTLVTLARAEKNPELKREIVSRLSNIKSKEATDYLLELLK